MTPTSHLLYSSSHGSSTSRMDSTEPCAVPPPAPIPCLVRVVLLQFRHADAAPLHGSTFSPGVPSSFSPSDDEEDEIKIAAHRNAVRPLLLQGKWEPTRIAFRGCLLLPYTKGDTVETLLHGLEWRLSSYLIPGGNDLFSATLSSPFPSSSLSPSSAFHRFHRKSGEKKGVASLSFTPSSEGLVTTPQDDTEEEAALDPMPPVRPSWNASVTPFRAESISRKTTRSEQQEWSTSKVVRVIGAFPLTSSFFFDADGSSTPKRGNRFSSVSKNRVEQKNITERDSMCEEEYEHTTFGKSKEHRNRTNCMKNERCGSCCGTSSSSENSSSSRSTWENIEDRDSSSDSFANTFENGVSHHHRDCESEAKDYFHYKEEEREGEGSLKGHGPSEVVRLLAFLQQNSNAVRPSFAVSSTSYSCTFSSPFPPSSSLRWQHQTRTPLRVSCFMRNDHILPCPFYTERDGEGRIPLCKEASYRTTEEDHPQHTETREETPMRQKNGRQEDGASSSTFDVPPEPPSFGPSREGKGLPCWTLCVVFGIYLTTTPPPPVTAAVLVEGKAVEGSPIQCPTTWTITSQQNDNVQQRTEKEITTIRGEKGVRKTVDDHVEVAKEEGLVKRAAFPIGSTSPRTSLSIPAPETTSPSFRLRLSSLTPSPFTTNSFLPSPLLFPLYCDKPSLREGGLARFPSSRQRAPVSRDGHQIIPTDDAPVTRYWTVRVCVHPLSPISPTFSTEEPKRWDERTPKKRLTMKAPPPRQYRVALRPTTTLEHLLHLPAMARSCRHGIVYLTAGGTAGQDAFTTTPSFSLQGKLFPCENAWALSCCIPMLVVHVLPRVVVTPAMIVLSPQEKSSCPSPVLSSSRSVVPCTRAVCSLSPANAEGHERRQQTPPAPPPTPMYRKESGTEEPDARVTAEAAPPKSTLRPISPPCLSSLEDTSPFVSSISTAVEPYRKRTPFSSCGAETTRQWRSQDGDEVHSSVTRPARKEDQFPDPLRAVSLSPPTVEEVSGSFVSCRAYSTPSVPTCVWGVSSEPVTYHTEEEIAAGREWSDEVEETYADCGAPLPSSLSHLGSDTWLSLRKESMERKWGGVGSTEASWTRLEDSDDEKVTHAGEALSWLSSSQRTVRLPSTRGSSFSMGAMGMHTPSQWASSGAERASPVSSSSWFAHPSAVSVETALVYREASSSYSPCDSLESLSSSSSFLSFPIGAPSRGITSQEQEELEGGSLGASSFAASPTVFSEEARRKKRKRLRPEEEEKIREKEPENDEDDEEEEEENISFTETSELFSSLSSSLRPSPSPF